MTRALMNGVLLTGLALSGCTDDASDNRFDAGGTGGAVVATGGSGAATGGYAAATGGAGPGTGGYVAATGGYVAATGGYVAATGGYVAATGGAIPATGGSAPATGGAPVGGAPSSELPGFFVSGRHLYDRCGERVVLRGVNEMIVWSGGKDGVPEYAEIAKTGANVVRIVWVTSATAAELDTAIANALAAGLIPMVELHDATGDWSKLPDLIDYWVRDDVVAVIAKYEQVLLVNIGNEVGQTVDETTWRTGYEDAITELRTAGIRTPLVVDANGYGQNIDMLQAQGPALVDHDPDHNVLLSVHMWWTDGDADKINDELDQSIALDLPLIVGEFAHHGVWQCSTYPFDYVALLAKAQAEGIGWLAWSWGAVENNDCKDDGPFDMSSDGTYEGLEGWGLAVAVTDTNSIQNTSVRPYSMVHGECAPAL